MDDVWSKLDYTIFDNEIDKTTGPDVTSDTITNYDEKLFESKLLNSILTSNDYMCCGDEEKSSSENIDHQLSQIMKSRSYRSEKNQISNSDNVIKDCMMEDGVNMSSAFLSSSKKNQLRHQNMDDFEQLLDIANASSNIINKNLVFKQQISNEGQNDTINNIVKQPSTKSVIELLQASSSSGISSLSSTKSAILINNKNQDATLLVEEVVNNIVGDVKNCAVDVEKSNSIEDFYQNMLDEIKTNWLHFRPKSPTLSSNLLFDSTEDFIFDSDLPYDTKFAVELQTLNGYEKNEDLDNKLYLTEPLTKDLFKRNNKSLTTAQLFPVKTEPIEMTDFNDTSNVDDLWNVLLKNCIDDDFSKKCSEPNMVEKTEICSEFYQSDAPERKRKRLNLDNDHWNHTKTGCSDFKLTEEVITDTRINVDSNLANEEQLPNQLEKQDVVTIKSEFPDSNNVAPHVIGNSTLNSLAIKSQNIVKDQPKTELMSHKYILQYGTPMTVSLPSTISLPSTPTNVNSSVSINSGMIATSSTSNAMYHQQLLSGTNTIISSAQNKLQFDSNTIVLAAPSSRKLNGPIDRNGNENKFLFVNVE